MIIQTATFDVVPDALQGCEAAIRDFVSYIEANEPGTSVYRSLRETGDPCRFLHIFLFADAEAEELHANSEAVRRFTETLYPNIVAPVAFARWEPVAMVDRR